MDFDFKNLNDITGGFKTVPDNFMPATGVCAPARMLVAVPWVKVAPECPQKPLQWPETRHEP